MKQSEGYRRIRPDEMESVIERAKKDHPRVRRIDDLTYGVTCSGKCSKNNVEHVIRFLIRPRGVWSLCEDCITNQFHIPHCRHVASALPLFIYYNEEKQEAA